MINTSNHHVINMANSIMSKLISSDQDTLRLVFDSDGDDTALSTEKLHTLTGLPWWLRW